MNEITNNNSNECYESIEESYIDIYVLINGVITIDKLLEILEKEHNILVNKEELEEIGKKLESITMCDTYLKLNSLSEEKVIELLEEKKGFSKYKIINNSIELLTNINNNLKNIKVICKKYKLPEILEAFLLSHTNETIITKTLLKEVLKIENVRLTEKEINRLYKELEKELDNSVLWAFNGYTKNEIKAIINNQKEELRKKNEEIRELKAQIKEKERKIGRNEPCPCGSGKKYKKCCGK